jgi:hypothetical protein
MPELSSDGSSSIEFRAGGRFLAPVAARALSRHLDSTAVYGPPKRERSAITLLTYACVSLYIPCACTDGRPW